MASVLRPRVTDTVAAGAGNINLLPSKLIELAKFVGNKSKIQGNAYIQYVTPVCKSPTEQLLIRNTYTRSARRKIFASNKKVINSF